MLKQLIFNFYRDSVEPKRMIKVVFELENLKLYINRFSDTLPMRSGEHGSCQKKHIVKYENCMEHFLK